MNRKIIKLFLIVIVSLALTNCGFKPRGKANQDLTDVIVNINAQQQFHPLVLRLKRKLQSLGAQLVDNESAQPAVLVLISLPIENQKTLSVDDTGRPLEYELHIEISAVVTSNHPKTKPSSASKLDETTPSTIFARRVLVYDNNQLLAKSREREQVRNAIYDVLVEQLIERIRGAHAVKS